MRHKINLLETFYAHAAKLAQSPALRAPTPYEKALAIATEQELQRLADRLDDVIGRLPREDSA